MRYTPTDITSTYAAITALNANFDDIQSLLEKCVFTDGTAPNAMEADFDMNHFNIKNVAEAVNPTDAINLEQATSLIGGVTISGDSFSSRALMTTIITSPVLNQHAVLTEPGREGTFIFSTDNLSTQVTADPNQGIYVAPTSDPTGASGAWVRIYEALRPEWFGARADGVTDDTASFAACVRMAAIVQKWVDGRGAVYAVTGKMSWRSNVWGKDFTLKQLAPGASASVVTLAADTLDNVKLVRIKVNRNGDGTNGGFATSAGVNGCLDTARGISVTSCTNSLFEDLEVTGDDTGTGIRFFGLDQTCAIVRPYAHDMNGIQASGDGTDEAVCGIDFDTCTGATIINATASNMSMTYGGVRDIWGTRGISVSGVQRCKFIAPNMYACGEAFDISSGSASADCIVIGGRVERTYSWGWKLAHDVRRWRFIGCSAYNCGDFGFVDSADAATVPLLNDANVFDNCEALNCGGPKAGYNAAVAGFGTLGTALTNPVSATFRNCRTIDNNGLSTTTYGFYNEKAVGPTCKVIFENCISQGHITAPFQGGTVIVDSQSSATRTLLAAIPNPVAGQMAFLTEAGREGWFEFNTADLSAFITADPNQGLYLAPASAPTGASGAWVRQFDRVNLGWFGLIENNALNSGQATSNTAAFVACKSILTARMLNGVAMETVIPPRGDYWFADSGNGIALDITLPMILDFGSAGATTFHFPAGVVGICTQHAQSHGTNGKDAVAHSSAFGTILRNIRLQGSYLTTEAEAHGVQLRVFTVVERPTISNFEGDGIHAVASTGAADGANPPFGNVNTSIIRDPNISSCRDGIAFQGSDTNACSIYAPNVNVCRRWGLSDRSLLGNAYFGGQLATNGITSHNDGVTIGASVVSSGGNRYGAIAGQEAGASTNAPSGTTADNTWWYYMGAGGAATGIPAWSSGILVRAGGCVFTDNNNARNTFSGIYYEDSQGFAQVVWPTVIFSGKLASFGYWKGSTGSNLRVSSEGKLQSDHGFDTIVGGYKVNGVSIVDGSGNSTPASMLSTGAIGYTTGAGGTVTQTTSKSTAVTLNKLCGEITMEATTSIGSAAGLSFTLNNSLIGAHDTLDLGFGGGVVDTSKYVLNWLINGPGTATISVRNVGASALAEALVLRFAVHKAVNA